MATEGDLVAAAMFTRCPVSGDCPVVTCEHHSMLLVLADEQSCILRQILPQRPPVEPARSLELTARRGAGRGLVGAVPGWGAERG